MTKSTNASPGDSILVVAAEASSTMYAKNFMKVWRQSFPQAQFYGIGDRQMESEGMKCLGLAEDLAVVGLQEVIAHFSEIKATFHGIIAEAKARPPRFALLLDYPGFNLRLAKKLKELGIPVVYYISPQLWAWKKGRVQQVKKYVDDMMVVFPFEVDFYKKYGVPAHFVGHPLVEVVTEEQNRAPAVSSPKKILGLMPGSRKSEIKFNLKTQCQAAQLLQKKTDVAVKVLVAPTLSRSEIQNTMTSLGFNFELVQEKPTAMIQSCDLILSASGTATLQVALCEKPMVVMYQMNPITAFIARRLVTSVDSFCIVNLIAGTKVVPEFFQEGANPESLSEALGRILSDPGYRTEMLQSLGQVKRLLGQGGATENLVAYLKNKYP